MPRFLLVVAALAVMSGCVRPAQPPSVARSACDASGVQSYTGRSWRVTLNDELLRAARSQVIRVMWPGEPVTLELHPSRLNVLLDRTNTIQQLYCG